MAVSNRIMERYSRQTCVCEKYGFTLICCHLHKVWFVLPWHFKHFHE